MKVFIVLDGVLHEGETIIAVCETIEKAKKAVSDKRKQLGSMVKKWVEEDNFYFYNTHYYLEIQEWDVE